VGDLDDIVRRLEPSLGSVGGTPTPLEGGITNRNFKVLFGNDEYVVRLHGKDTDLLGISREAEQLANEAAAALDIAPAVAASFPGGLVTRYVACAPLGDGGAAAHVEQIAGALRRFHGCRAQLPVDFSIPALLEDYIATLRARGRKAPAALLDALATGRQIEAALDGRTGCPCHNDLLPGNLLRGHSDERILIVDWEYAGMGHPYFDLGNLAVNNDFDDATELRLLSAYEGRPPTVAQQARLKLMRVLSDVREAAWGVIQASVSDLDFDFDGYARKHFERLLSTRTQPGYEDWLKASAG
jgi:thiamine kinase-like enzyme